MFFDRKERNSFPPIRLLQQQFTPYTRFHQLFPSLIPRSSLKYTSLLLSFFFVTEPLFGEDFFPLSSSPQKLVYVCVFSCLILLLSFFSTTSSSLITASVCTVRDCLNSHSQSLLSPSLLLFRFDNFYLLFPNDRQQIIILMMTTLLLLLFHSCGRENVKEKKAERKETRTHSQSFALCYFAPELLPSSSLSFRSCCRCFSIAAQLFEQKQYPVMCFRKKRERKLSSRLNKRSLIVIDRSPGCMCLVYYVFSCFLFCCCLIINLLFFLLLFLP